MTEANVKYNGINPETVLVKMMAMIGRIIFQ